MSPFTVYFCFRKKRERNVKLLGKILDLLSTPRFLTSKLIAWKCKNLKVFMSFVQGLELLVVFVGQTSLGGDVDK